MMRDSFKNFLKKKLLACSPLYTNNSWLPCHLTIICYKTHKAVGRFDNLLYWGTPWSKETLKTPLLLPIITLCHLTLLTDCAEANLLPNTPSWTLLTLVVFNISLLHTRSLPAKARSWNIWFNLVFCTLH